MDTSKVWYLTGASQGLGLTLVKKLLDTGHRVAATTRNIQALRKAVGMVDSDHFLPLSVDLNNPESVDDSIRESQNAFGRIDVVVNNAGYGMADIIAAITAFSEVLALDVKEFGIKVMIVEPSGFRAGFPSENSLAHTESKIDGYRVVKETQQRYLAGNGRQPGDPEIASSIIMELAGNDHPPIHLYLGQDAYMRASGKIAVMRGELEV